MKSSGKIKRRFVQIEELTEEQRTSIAEALLKHRIQLDDFGFHLLIVGVENGLWAYAFFLNYELGQNERGLRSRDSVSRNIEKLRSALSGLSDAAHGVLSSAYQHTPTAKAFHEARVSTGIDSQRFFEEVADNMEGDPFGAMGYFDLFKNAMIEACALALTNPPPKEFDYHKNTDSDIVSIHTNKRHRPKGEIWERFVLELATLFESRTGRKATSSPSGAFDDFLSACLKIIEPNRGAETNRKLIEKSLPKYQKKKCPETTRK